MPQPSRRSRKPQTNRIAEFFLWCAGSDRAVIDKVPRSEATKQIGYGTLVIVPAVLAFFAMSYALSTLTTHTAVYLSGGLVWSVIVFCFDRFIVSTFRKSASTIDDITSTVFLSRLAFAAFVGILVAHPLVMLYFNDSIEERLSLEGRGKLAQIDAEYASKQVELEARIASLKTELRERERERNEYQAALVDEIDGVVSGRTSGVPGRGASAEEKKLQLLTAQVELDAARDRNLSEIASLQAQIGTVQEEAATDKASFSQSTDYLARAGALEALSREHQHVRNVKWFIIMFFVFVDTLPILFKGFTPRGPYDDTLALAEFKSERSTQAERDSLDRVLYPHMVISRENRFLSSQNHRGVKDYAERYRSFLDQLAAHQDEFLVEWQRQQEVLARLEDEDLRRTQLSYMDKIRDSSSDVVNKAVEQFQRSLAWDSRKNEAGEEPA